jgi:hypothetical protein
MRDRLNEAARLFERGFLQGLGQGQAGVRKVRMVEQADCLPRRREDAKSRKPRIATRSSECTDRRIISREDAKKTGAEPAVAKAGLF